MTRSSPESGAEPGLETGPTSAGARVAKGWVWLRASLYLLAAALYALHFVHLSADFPHDSPWNDWAKYTDEGWYGDAAIRHFVLGHWFLPGDFNPAVAMPVWPLLEAVVFRVTGVSLAAARALAVAVFGVALLALGDLLRRHAAEPGRRRLGLAAPLAVVLASASPFLFAFDRLAILEPPVAALSLLVLWSASFLQPWTGRRAGSVRVLAAALATGVALALVVLTKPTAVALFPAFALYLWLRSGRRLKAFAELAALPAGVGAALWLGYYLLLVRPHYLADFQYLFDANAYTGFQLEPLAVVLVNTVTDVRFVGAVLYAVFCVSLASFALLRPRFFRNALVPTFLLWIGGYLLLLGYHNNLQPRYYLLLAVPMTALVALALEEGLRWALATRLRLVRGLGVAAVAGCAAAIVIPGVWQEMDYALHPDYSYLAAARRIAAIVRADPSRAQTILSVSGSELTLMTGLPSIDDDFGTLDLDQRVRLYRPGWYVAWNQIDDDKMDALRGLYRPVRAAAIPAMDDPDRNLLILYRLDPIGGAPPSTAHRRGHTPRALRTRFGQQPATTQLRH